MFSPAFKPFRREHQPQGETHVSKPTAAQKRQASEFVLDGESVWPRTIKERYGIFRVKDGGRPDLTATCRTKGEIGTVLVTQGEEGMFLDYCVGIMDGRDHKNEDGKWIGKWLVLPWVSHPKKETT